MELVIKFVTLFLILIASPLHASESDLDISNQLVATKWEQINRNVDMFFTNQKYTKQQENKSSIFFYTTTYKTEGHPLKTDYDFKVKFDLPNTTKKLKIVVEKQQDEISDALSDSSSPEERGNRQNNRSTNVHNTDTHYTAGANYLLKQSQYFSSYLRFGFRIDMPLNPSVKLDLNENIETHFMTIKLLQKMLYYRQEGFQNISQVVFNKIFTENLQMDFLHSLVWTDESDEFVLRHSIVLYQDLGNDKGMSYSVGANALFKPVFHYDSYDTSISFRQLLHSHWLYGTFTIGANFTKAEHFNDEKFVQLRFDIFFKDKYEK